MPSYTTLLITSFNFDVWSPRCTTYHEFRTAENNSATLFAALSCLRCRAANA